MSIVVTQGLSWERKSNAFLSPQSAYTYVEWLLVLACLVRQYSEISYLISCPLPCRNPACSSAITVSVFTRILSSMIR